MTKYIKPKWNFLSCNANQICCIDGISVTELAKKYGTPLYIVVESQIRKQVRRMKNAFPYQNLCIQYASKCNTNLQILRIMKEEGLELDVSSVGEIILGLLAGFKPQQMVFTNLYKSDQDICFAANIGIQAIAIDSIEELKRVKKITEEIKNNLDIFLRISPNINNKSYSTDKFHYGIPYNDAKSATDLVLESKYINLIGYHFHGGYIPEWKIYLMAAEKLLKLTKYAIDKGAKITSIDLGGGIPVEYKSKVFTPEDMGEEFTKKFKKLLNKFDLPELKLIFEPGKFCVANAGIGLVKVISKKKHETKSMIITDGSTYAMLPDPIIYHCHYDILPATKMNCEKADTFTIFGCTCDCIDILGKNRQLPNLEENDLLAIMDCGAYSNVIASNFNTIKRPPMVMITEDKTTKLIKRRDKYSDMFSPELDVLKFAGPKELKKLYKSYGINIEKNWEE